MSYDLTAYVRSERLPSMSALAAHLQRTGGRIAIDDLDDVTAMHGYVPVTLDGAPTGFEVYWSEITDERRSSYRQRLARNRETPGEYLEILTTCDRDVGFSCKSGDAREVAAARLVANALASLAGGWVRDPQTKEVVRYAAR